MNTRRSKKKYEKDESSSLCERLRSVRVRASANNPLLLSLRTYRETKDEIKGKKKNERRPNVVHFS